MHQTRYFSTNRINLRKTNRLWMAQKVLNQPISADMLLEEIAHAPLHYKIVYFHVLDLVVEMETNYLNTSLSLFLHIGLSQTHESIKRCVSRTLLQQVKREKLLYTPKQKEQIVHTLFDWLLLPSAVATRVNAIEALFYLRNTAPWIEEHLLQMIEINTRLQEPSLLSRAKKIKHLLEKQKIVKTKNEE